MADGQTAMIGSQNLANSLENNRELGIVFDDPAAVNRLARFLLDWNKPSRGASRSPRATPSCRPAASAWRCGPWQEVARYAGQTVTVEGDIVDTYDSGKVTFLNFDEAHLHRGGFRQRLRRFPSRRRTCTGANRCG